MASTAPWTTNKPTGLIVLANGTVIEGRGLGATGSAVGEICFNTALTGYEEILTDPSYAGQIVTFTFPHIGNVGTNEEDIEDLHPAARAGAVGAIFRAGITDPSNYRADSGLDQWLKRRGIVAVSGHGHTRLDSSHPRGRQPECDRRPPSRRHFRYREPEGTGKGMVRARRSRPRQGGDVRAVLDMDGTPWVWNEGYSEQDDPFMHVVAVDYGVKRNILRLLSGMGAKVTVVPATMPAADILAMEPDGVFLSNGPGDPAATGEYAVPIIQGLLEADVPIFGICLGHQMLGLALGGKTLKMHQGHHGANHPVKDYTTGKVEIVSMNHGFALDADTLPEGVEETHVSLFDGSNCGLAITGRPVFSVQHHPEASPGPQDSHYLFRRFANLILERRGEPALAER